MRTIEITTENADNYYIREAFNTLRTNIQFCGKETKTIVVTSCFAHEGKTTISLDMARSLAEAGKRVLLIDADLRKSVTVSRYTKERGITGLSQLLSGQISLENAVYHTQFENMDMIFAGPYPPNPAELVGGASFRELLSITRNQYDYVIVDAPPLGLVIDSAVIASMCDGAVIVINIGHVKYRVALNVKEQLEKSGCRILGVILNQVDRKKIVSGSTYGYYSYDYGDSRGQREGEAARMQNRSMHSSDTVRRPTSVPGSGTSRPTSMPGSRPDSRK